MTDDRLPLAELLAKAGDGDVLRSVAEAVLQMVMEADVEGLIGAGRYERTGERLNWHNGFRDRTLDTRLGALHLRMSCTRFLWTHICPRRDRNEGIQHDEDRPPFCC
jgi:transposase-like protein